MKEQHPDTCAIVIDQANERIIEVRKSMLINQISRDAEKIAKSFDAIVASDLDKISTQFSHCYAVVTSGLIKAAAEEDDLRIACGELLTNSLNSIAASTYMLRGGFILQPGPVIRSAIESMAVALHLMQFQDDLTKHRDHKFESTRAIASAKRVFPPFGKIYGFLSKEFTHIGQLHKQLTPIREYTNSDESLSFNMQLITSGVWMCYVASELVFLDVVAHPRYWHELNHEVKGQTAYCYDPATDEKSWMKDFLGLDSPLLS
jgi:hypothetical protein